MVEDFPREIMLPAGIIKEAESNRRRRPDFEFRRLSFGGLGLQADGVDKLLLPKPPAPTLPVDGRVQRW